MKKISRINHPNYCKPDGFDDELPTYEENLYFKNENADDFFGENCTAHLPSALCGENKSAPNSLKKLRTKNFKKDKIVRKTEK